MVLRNVSYLILYVLVPIIYLLVNQYQSAPVTEYPNLGSGHLSQPVERFRSLFNRTQNIVNRFQCQKGWEQFGGSCYHPSIMKSTPDKAKETCRLLQVNDTHLMRIRHPVELSYAAHIFFTKNLTTLLIETDPRLIKSKMFMDMASASNRAEWQIIENKLSDVRLEFKLKQRSFRLNTTGDKKNGRVGNSNIPSFDKEKNVERFDTIRHFCDQFIWSVSNNDSYIFIFNTYKYSDKLVCLLSNDIDLNLTYEYVCQYVLDFCFGNILCGKNGECANSLEGFKCACSFFFGGDRCKKFVHQKLQMFIAGILIFILYSIILIRFGIKKIKKWCEKNDTDSNKTKTKQSNTTSKSDRKSKPTKREMEQKRKNLIRMILLSFLFLLCFCFMIVIPTVVQILSYLFVDIDPSRSQSVITEALSTLKKCERTSFFPIEDRIFLGASIILTISFVLLTITMKQNRTDNQSSTNENNNSQLKTNRSSKTNQRKYWKRPKSSTTTPEIPEEVEMLPSPQTSQLDAVPLSKTAIPRNPQKSLDERFSLTELYRNISRYEMAATFGILTFEILKVFDKVLFAISESSDDGVLIIFFKRIFIVFLIGSRYYPILISLHLHRILISLHLHPENKSAQIAIVQFLTFAYVTGIITYTIYRESFCLDFLPHSQSFSPQDEFQLRITLNTRFIIYGLFANVPHFALLSYIAAEFGMRLVFDSRYGYQEEDKTENIPKSETESSSNNRNNNRTTFQKFRDSIYIWDTGFLYSPMILSTYIVNLIILVHFACTFGFLYTTRMMSPISFMTKSLEQMLQIEIKDQLLQVEVILSAIITTSIYGIQLFFGLKKYREDIKDYRRKGLESMIKDKGIIKKHSRSKAIQYPGYLIRYTLGGFVITFHLLIFIIFIPRLLWYHYYAFGWIFEIISPILISYALQSLIAKLSSRLVDTGNQEVVTENVNNAQIPPTQNIPANDSQWKNNLKNILQYFILVANCFIGIISSIMRLILGLILNIVYMNRIDFCLFRESLEKFDRANAAYWGFLHEEIISMQREEQDAQTSPSTKPSRKDEESDGGTSPGEQSEGEYTDDESGISDYILPEETNEPKNSSKEKSTKKTGEKEDTASSMTDVNRGLNRDQLYFLYNNKNMTKTKDAINKSSPIAVKTQLAAIRSKKIDVLGDGSCFFRAISHQLYGDQKNHSKIRTDAVRYIKSHKEDFKLFMDTSEYPTIKNYIEQMHQDKTYADHPAILATAIINNKNIIVHEIGKLPLKIPGSDCFDNQLHVWYDANAEHYGSVVRHDGSGLHLLPEQVRNTN